MRLLYDFFPMLLFFIAYQRYGIYWATAAAIGTTLCQFAYTLFQKKRVEPLQGLLLGLLLILGGATLLFQNPRFIQWKPTVVYWVLAGLFVGSIYFRPKPLIYTLLHKQLTLPDNAWRRLNALWSHFFFWMGVLNLTIAYTCQMSTWVTFKFLGTLLLTLLFAGVQIAFLIRTQAQTNDRQELL